jgi:hypothetical protein
MILSRTGRSPPRKTAKKPGKKTLAAIRIQRCWRSYVLCVAARHELMFLKAKRCVAVIERTWIGYVRRLNARLSLEFDQWLKRRLRRFFHACIYCVKLNAVHRRHAAIVIGRWARTRLVALRRTDLFRHRKAWRIQRCYRRALHRSRTKALQDHCEEMLWFFKVEARERSMLLREDRDFRRQVAAARSDLNAKLFAYDAGPTPTPPPRRVEASSDAVRPESCAVRDFKQYRHGLPKPVAFTCPARPASASLRPRTRL